MSFFRRRTFFATIPNSRRLTAVIPQEFSGAMQPSGNTVASIRARQWSVADLSDHDRHTVSFRRIDELMSRDASSPADHSQDRDSAVIMANEELQWKRKLMFGAHKIRKTPKHLTWLELGQEIDCLECTIEPDKDNPENMFSMSFHFVDRQSGVRDNIWTARNSVSASPALTDLLAAVGTCLSRADAHRTIVFDDGEGTTRELSLRKRSRYSSDIWVGFRPAVCNSGSVDTKKQTWWGFHSSMMDPEYRDSDDEGTYQLAVSAHAFSCCILRSLTRLVTNPLERFYSSSQLQYSRSIGQVCSEGPSLSEAIQGWLGIEPKRFPHWTPIEAIEAHWVDENCPYTLIAIVNKLREMTYVQKQNLEFRSWLSVRQMETKCALQNVKAKLTAPAGGLRLLPRRND